jgi:hypothetical protein
MHAKNAPGIFSESIFFAGIIRGCRITAKNPTTCMHSILWLSDNCDESDNQNTFTRKLVG